jgi:hypothetical protein
MLDAVLTAMSRPPRYPKVKYALSPRQTTLNRVQCVQGLESSKMVECDEDALRFVRRRSLDASI